MPPIGFRFDCDPQWTKELREFFERLQVRIGGKYKAVEAAKALNVFNSDLTNNIFNKNRSVRCSGKFAENLIEGLRGERPASRNFESTPEVDKFWEANQALREELANSLERQLNSAKNLPLKMPVLPMPAVTQSQPVKTLGQPKVSSATSWSWITPEEFALPAEGAEGQIREFLRGQQRVPLWLARHGSVWRGDEVGKILSQLDDSNFVTLHGPAAQGKSMIAMQTMAAWVEMGRPALIAHTHAALHSPELEEACRNSEQPLVLLDDIVISSALPPWFNLTGKPVALVLQTTQTRKLDKQRMFLGEGAKRFRVSSPQNAQPFVENLIRYNAGASTDPKEVEKSFVEGLSRRNFGGGLWEATWEATRGEKIDARIGSIVSEIFENPDRKADAIAIAVVAFVNGTNEFAQSDDLYSRLLIDLKRSSIARFVDGHPDWDQDAKNLARASLERIGSILSDELFNVGRNPAFMDLNADPQVEFRSAGVTHSFYRWIFGQLSGDGSYYLSRWQFFAALPHYLKAREAGPEQYVGALRSLLRAWNIKPQLRLKFDHGRSSADIEKLARDIYDATPHQEFNAKCRLDYGYASANLWAASEPGIGGNARAEHFGRAVDRLKAATVPGAPADVLMSAAQAILNFDITLESEDSVEDYLILFERIIDSRASVYQKVFARAYRFKLICIHKQRIKFDPSWANLSFRELSILFKDPRFLGIIHGFLDIMSSPVNNNMEEVRQFYSSQSDAYGLGSMLGMFGLVVERLAENKRFMRWLQEAISANDQENTLRSHRNVAAISRLIRAASQHYVPLREIYGDEIAVLLRSVTDEIQRNEYHNLAHWLSKTSAALKTHRSIEKV